MWPSSRLLRLIVAAGVVGIGASLLGAAVAWAFVGNLLTGVDQTLTLTLQTLDTLDETLVAGRETLTSAAEGIERVEATVDGVEAGLAETEDVLRLVEQLAAEDIPSGLGSIEDTMPNLIRLGRTIDSAMIGLSAFGIVDEAPEESLEESLSRLDEGLEALSGDLRAQGHSIAQLRVHAGDVRESMAGMGPVLVEVEDRLRASGQLMDAYAGDVEATGGALGATQGELQRNAQLARVLALVVGLSLALSQGVMVALALTLSKTSGS